MASTSTEAHSTRIIHSWSGPRSLSTAMLYSFAQRPDCQTFDEPLYANYLRTFAALHRPYRHQLLEAEPRSSNEVLSSIIEASKSKMVFVKHIIKQYTDDIDFDLLTTPGTAHIFLIRNPLDMIMSWNQKNHVHNESQDIYGTTVMELVALFTKLKSKTGITPIVIDVDELVKDPEGVLSSACKTMNIPFDPQQLTWPEGPKPDIDGLWASFWYDSVHKTTGFNQKKCETTLQVAPFTSDNYLVYRDAFPFYEMLRNYAIGIHPFARGQTHCPGQTSNQNVAPVHDHGRLLELSSLSDPRNAQTLIWVGDRLIPREYAKVSVFDSTVQGGDAVWEGLRVYNKKIFMLEEHLHRLMDSAKALAFERVPDLNYIRQAVFKTLTGFLSQKTHLSDLANAMFNDCHIRLTLSRGTKITSSMNPMFNIFGCVLLVVPEWKPVGNSATYNNDAGIKLVTSYNRRNSSSCLDSKIHHCNLINNILPKIQANQFGAADALMLDIDGFVSETNATNIFLVKNGQVSTPSADACLPGITRQIVINLLKQFPQISIAERRISLVEFHTADEVFTTGTMGELTPVVEIDGRTIGDGNRPITRLIQEQFKLLTETEGVIIPGCF